MNEETIRQKRPLSSTQNTNPESPGNRNMNNSGQISWNQLNESSFVPSSGLSIDHNSMGESYEDMDSLSDISTEKSEADDGESITKRSKNRGPGDPKNKEGMVDQKMKSKNREHAKKTRIKKKNYIESLKETVKYYSNERERQDRDSRITLSRLAEQTKVRKQVLQTMFYYRAVAETNPVKWNTVLDENFVFIMPITPYRSFPPAQVINGQRMISGIDGMIKDTASLHVLAQSIGQIKYDGDSVRIQYYSELDDGIMNHDSFMCRWLMKTENAVERGARQEVYKHGMVQAHFSPQNKLMKLEMSFDVMSFMQQLRRASGRYDFQVVPNTLNLASTQDSNDPHIIIEAVEPFYIITSNTYWTETFGYQMTETVGQPFHLFKGPQTESAIYQQLIRAIESGTAYTTRITCITASNNYQRMNINMYPLYNNSFVSHYLCVFEKIYDIPMITLSNSNASVCASTSNSCYNTNEDASENTGMDNHHSHTSHHSGSYNNNTHGNNSNSTSYTYNTNNPLTSTTPRHNNNNNNNTNSSMNMTSQQGNNNVGSTKYGTNSESGHTTASVMTSLNTHGYGLNTNYTKSNTTYNSNNNNNNNYGNTYNNNNNNMNNHGMNNNNSNNNNINNSNNITGMTVNSPRMSQQQQQQSSSMSSQSIPRSIQDPSFTNHQTSYSNNNNNNNSYNNNYGNTSVTSSNSSHNAMIPPMSPPKNNNNNNNNNMNNHTHTSNNSNNTNNNNNNNNQYNMNSGNNNNNNNSSGGSGGGVGSVGGYLSSMYSQSSPRGGPSPINIPTNHHNHNNSNNNYNNNGSNSNSSPSNGSNTNTNNNNSNNGNGNGSNSNNTSNNSNNSNSNSNNNGSNNSVPRFKPVGSNNTNTTTSNNNNNMTTTNTTNNSSGNNKRSADGNMMNASSSSNNNNNNNSNNNNNYLNMTMGMRHPTTTTMMDNINNNDMSTMIDTSNMTSAAETMNQLTALNMNNLGLSAYDSGRSSNSSANSSNNDGHTYNSLKGSSNSNTITDDILKPILHLSTTPPGDDLVMNAAAVIYGVLGDVSTFDWTDFLDEDMNYTSSQIQSLTGSSNNLQSFLQNPFSKNSLSGSNMSMSSMKEMTATGTSNTSNNNSTTNNNLPLNSNLLMSYQAQQMSNSRQQNNTRNTDTPLTNISINPNDMIDISSNESNDSRRSK